MAEKDSIRDIGMTIRSILATCSQSSQGRMTNTQMRSHTHVETRHKAVVHTDVPGRTVLSPGRELFFVTTIDEGSSHVKAFHMNTKGEVVDILKYYIRGLECQTKAPMKKVVLNGGKWYLDGSRDLEEDGIESSTPASYTLQEDVRPKE